MSPGFCCVELLTAAKVPTLVGRGAGFILERMLFFMKPAADLCRLVASQVLL